MMYRIERLDFPMVAWGEVEATRNLDEAVAMADCHWMGQVGSRHAVRVVAIDPRQPFPPVEVYTVGTPWF